MQTVAKDNSGKWEMSVEALMMSRRTVQLGRLYEGRHVLHGGGGREVRAR